MSLNELLEEIFDTDVISLEDYRNRINEVENFFLNNGNSEWKTYYRGDKFCSKTQSNFFRFGDIKEEGKKFKKWKERHLDLCNKYDDEFMRLAYMQHYAGNTRLLDFTEDPTVALRFACGKAEISPYECPRKVTIYNTKCIEYHEPQAKRTLQAFMELISSDNQEEIKRIIEKNGEVLKKDYFVEMPKTFPRIEKQNGLFLLMGNFTTGELISGKQDFNRTNKVKHELSPTIGRGCQYEGFVGVLRISPCAVAKIRDELEHTTCYRMDYLMEEN